MIAHGRVLASLLNRWAGREKGYARPARLLLAAVALVAVACAAPAAAPSPVATAAPSPTAAPAKARVFVFSNSSPHVSVIDGETHKVIRTADVPNLKSWTWNDDNNYFDGRDLWLGTRNPDTNEAEVITLNLETLEVTARIPLGTEKTTLYIGKPTRDGRLFVGKHASWQMAIIDTKARRLLKTVDVPVNAGDKGTPPRWAVCDSDANVGPDGVERVYYPTNAGTSTVGLDSATAQVLKQVDHPAGSRPCMLTVSPDGKVWVQECDANTNAVLDPVTLEVVKRFATGKGPVVASFSQDGKYGYIGHSGDSVLSVVDARSLTEIQRIQVGTNAEKVGAHPSGKFVYVIVTKEASVAVIDTATWSVSERVPLGTNPSGIYVQTVK